MSALQAIAQALADETRLRILACLRTTPLCLCHLTQIVGLAASTVSRHLHILEEAGLVVGWQEGRWRYYRWAGEEAGRCAAGALVWVARFLDDLPQSGEDLARKAIALQTCAAPVPREPRPRVLFMCTGNSCRSQMAEGLLRHFAGERFEVESAGLEPRAIPAETIRVMDELGIDIRGQRPKDLRGFLGRRHFHYLISVCANAEARCPIFPGVSRRLSWPVDDPAACQGDQEARLARFRAVRDEIAARIRAWLEDPQTRKGGP